MCMPALGSHCSVYNSFIRSLQAMHFVYNWLNKSIHQLLFQNSIPFELFFFKDPVNRNLKTFKTLKARL